MRVRIRAGSELVPCTLYRNFRRLKSSKKSVGGWRGQVWAQTSACNARTRYCQLVPAQDECRPVSLSTLDLGKGRISSAWPSHPRQPGPKCSFPLNGLFQQSEDDLCAMSSRAHHQWSPAEADEEPTRADRDPVPPVRLGEAPTPGRHVGADRSTT